MKLAHLMLGLILVLSSTVQAAPLVFTFDDIPTGETGLWYYGNTYGVGFDHMDMTVVDHSNSSWGRPHSGSNVLVAKPDMPPDAWGTELVALKDHTGPLRADSVGGYFSTEYGASLQMIGYDLYGNQVTTPSLIGATDQAWNNVPVEVTSASGQITGVVLWALTSGSVSHFCVDDVNVDFVPEPSSLLALAGGLAGLGGMILKRKRY